MSLYSKARSFSDEKSPQPVVEHTEFDIDNILRRLTLAEKVALISGTDFWHSASIPRLEIPAVRVSDGPNGVRGTKFFNGVPAACFPCGTALGATWDVELLKKTGVLQAQEAIAKGAAAILDPTVNIQRSPVGGRGFELYSEDPTLSGVLSSAVVNGIQSRGVAATLKHFVCNDQEDHRQSVSCVVTDRALREIYLMPFQITQKDAKPMAFMTGYNKVNGTHCSHSRRLLQGVLRDEWGFDGLVMSDWYGTYSTAEAIKAGLDLEMPGPTIWRGQLITKAIRCGTLSMHQLDRCVRRMLQFVKHSLPLGLPENAREFALDTPEISRVLRQVAAESIVLLKNESQLLPLSPKKRTAVIGPNAAIAAYCGGGSAALNPYYTITPLSGISSQCENVSYVYGISGMKNLPPLSDLCKTKNGDQGLDMTVYLEHSSVSDRKSIDYVDARKSDILFMDYKHPEIPTTLFYADLEGTVTVQESGFYDFSLSVAGTAKLYIDDECIIDNDTTQTAGSSFFSTGTIEELGSKALEAGQVYKVRVTFESDPTLKFSREGVTGFGPGGVRIGACRRFDAAEELEKACTAASEAD